RAWDEGKPQEKLHKEEIMTEKARVMFMDKELVHLACIDEGSCASCSGKHFCNVTGKTFTAVNKQHLDIHTGDDVEVFLPPGKTIFSGFMVMMVPLIFFIIGFMLTRYAAPQSGEGLQALGGFLGLAFGFLTAYVFGLSQKKKNQPLITTILKQRKDVPQAEKG
ncbi:MAG: SoxR reducing system RseC family protein, partial [Spirochaetales bacterium]|nr:SoxR reducing system RseC family protein [Spirochaetales bacterium]